MIYSGTVIKVNQAFTCLYLINLRVRECMTEQYWIGDFFINLPRNQITHDEHTQALPPKALAVLTYLAKHQGDVVSQEDLLNQERLAKRQYYC